MAITPDQLESILLKRAPELTDEDLSGLQEIPEAFYPTNPHGHTHAKLRVEQNRRADAGRATPEEICSAAFDYVFARYVLSYGPGVFPIIDKVGRGLLDKELKRREKVFEDLFRRR